MKDSALFILFGIFCNVLVLIFAAINASILPMAAFCLLGIGSIVCGFELLISDK
jgi:hypothetical protein